jgi:hypothetical protein
VADEDGITSTQRGDDRSDVARDRRKVVAAGSVVAAAEAAKIHRHGAVSGLGEHR